MENKMVKVLQTVILLKEMFNFNLSATYITEHDLYKQAYPIRIFVIFVN